MSEREIVMDNVKLDFTEIAERVRKIDLPQVDLVVGIATGGTVPASLVAYRLNVPLVMMQINYRDETNTPQHDAPVLLNDPAIPTEKRRILLVDDVSVSGKTLDFARTVLSGHEIQTLVLKGHADHVVFPEIA